MPIQFAHELHRTSKAIRLEDSLKSNDKAWMAWWYCGIHKNQKAASQPSALVAFREVLSAGLVSDQVIYRRVPLTALGQVRIGTVWRDGACRAEAVFQKVEFHVDFTEGSWNLTSFHQAVRNDVELPYPLSIHPLEYKKDRNWLLEFQLPSGGKLVIPCLEFFTRCYGRSAELRRVLATYSWQECEEKRLFAPLDESEEPGKWKVKLRKRLVNGDVILLAHAKYDPFAAHAVKIIYAQIEALHVPGSKVPTFIKVSPWFRGPTKISVRGIWFDEGRSFLATQIVGCGDPIGVPVLRDRENTSLTELPADGEHGQLGEAWNGAVKRKLVKPPAIIDLTGDVEPDPDAISAEVEDPDFEVLGKPRVVIDMRKDRAKGSAGHKLEGSDASAYSSGEPHGRDQGVGYAAIHTRQVFESHGALRDMWNAMLLLKAKHGDLIQSVEWFTFEDGYRSDVEPNLIKLRPFKMEDNVDGTTRKWPYMDNVTLLQLRGVLTTRVIAMGKHIHIFEIQRRPRTKTDSNGNMEDVEDSFRGLVFVLDDQNELEAWIRQFLTNVRPVRGVVERLVGECPGNAYAFKHSAASHEEVPCEAAVINALGKMGVKVPKARVAPNRIVEAP